MTMERSNAAMDVYMAKIDDSAYCERIRDAQWRLVERDGISMDDAFVFAVEAAA